MIIEMVVRDIGKDPARETKPGDALLCDRMRTHFHEGVRTTLVDHRGEQRIQLNRVGSRMG